jgi:hypothetical protein
MIMKKALILTILVYFVLLGFGQSNDHFSPQQFIDRLSTTNRYGMLVLGGWGITNLVGGGLLSTQQTGTSKYFWQMNAAWNSVNLTIAAVGYFGSGKDWSTTSELLSIIDNYQKAYLFNAGLDVGYVMTGFYLKELSNRKPLHADRLKGYGNAMILQGTFLFVFDLVMYGINRNQVKIDINPLIDSLNAMAGLSVHYTL